MYSRYYMILGILYAGLVGSICLKGHLDEIWLPLTLYFETLYCLDLFGYIIAYILWPERDVFGEIHQNLGVERIVIYLVSRTLMAALILLLIRESRKVRELFARNRWMWIALPLLEHLTLYSCDVILIVGEESAGIRNWRAALLLWPLLLVTLVCAVGLQKYKMRNEQLEQQNRLYAREYELNQNSMLKKERFYHDMKNHLILLQKMAKEGDLDQLEGYIDRLLEPIKTEAIKEKTGNPLLDYLLLCSNYFVCKEINKMAFALDYNGNVRTCSKIYADNVKGVLNDKGMIEINDKFKKFYLKTNTVCIGCVFEPLCQGKSCGLKNVCDKEHIEIMVNDYIEKQVKKTAYQEI